MSIIYKITNDINNKIYVGKTNLTIQERLRQHFRDSRKENIKTRPLYSAMQKYGIEHFKIEEIENCLPEEASEKEQYWITYYKGYEEGYNATKGGDGILLFNHSQIAERLKNYPYPKDVAKEFNCSPDTVRTIAKEFGIKVKNKGQETNLRPKKQVHQYTKDGQYIQTFSSTAEALEWCYAQGLVKTINSGARGHIGEAARGLRKSAYSYCWKYDD